MNTKEYIESGVLDLYVSGLLSIEEMRDVESKACQFSEVKAELESLQNTLEKFAMVHAISPPPELKQRVMNAIQNQDEAVQLSSPGKVRSIDSSQGRFSRYLAAASIALLIVAGALALYFSSQYRKSKDQIAQMQTQFQDQQSAFQKQIGDLQTAATDNAARIQAVTDTSVVRIEMKGTTNHKGNVALIYWNKRTQDVYLKVASLPVPPSDQQYQLWFINTNKVPVSAGVFDVHPGEMLKMSPAINAAAFAVTLEPRGGSPTPTLSNMYVIGNVNS